MAQVTTRKIVYQTGSVTVIVKVIRVGYRGEVQRSQMPANQASEVLQHLRRSVLLQDRAALTDAQLLSEYIIRREEAALAVLVRRHGPMVWGVCRRILNNHHDAEDAFQATFLVLVRKAASIAPRDMVANWLYGVANQTAMKSRSAAIKKSAREKQLIEFPVLSSVEKKSRHDLRPLLDEELNCLPSKYRAAIVLCDLEGKTRKEAALLLNVPEGTVAGRLARARAMVARRLARRGVLLSGGVLAAFLAQQSVSASVPAWLESSTITAAGSFAAGHIAAAGVVSINAAALTNGVLKSMFLAQLKSVMAALVVVTVLGGSAGLLALRTQAGEKDDSQKAQPKKVEKAELAQDDKTKSDKEKLQGEWSATSLEIDGKDFSNKLSKGWKIVFDGDKVTGLPGDKAGSAAAAELSFKLNSERSPKEIDVFQDGNEVKLKAIYELDGATLKLCWSRGSERATEFNSSKAILAVFEKKN